MLTAIIVIIGLSLLILGHEAGHFFAAKFFKLRVDEFGFGFPPRMFAKKKGETEYSVNWLPFGGFVKIAGENDQFDETAGVATEANKDDRARFFYAQSAWKRSAIILAGVFVNFLLGWLLISAVLAIGTPEAVVVTGVLPESPASAAGFKEQDIFKNYSAIPEIIAALGEAKEEAVPFELLRGAESVSVSLSPETDVSAVPEAVFVSKVQPDSPAESVGIAAGDVVAGYRSVKEFVAYINAHRGEKIEIELVRGGERVTVLPTIRTDTREGGLGVFLAEGTLLQSEGLLLSEVGMPGENIFSALVDGARETAILSWLTLRGFGSLVADLIFRASLQEGIVGPVGIFSFAADAGQFGFTSLLYLIAVISVNLAVINLIPFPALDGGRFFLIIIEKIKGSPVPRKIEGIVNTAGFALLILLMIAISVRDIAGLFS